MERIENAILEINGQKWLVREARSEEDARNTIAEARCTGSIGQKDVLDETRIGGKIVVMANVVRLNSDGTECKPWSPS